MPTPKPGPGEVLVQVKAAAINPSDIKNVLGFMHITTPAAARRDAILRGWSRRGSSALVGKSVFGSGGNLGLGRDGSHAEFVTVPEAAVLPMPKGFTFEQAAAVGVAYMTAWAAIVKAARLQKGETALILGTTGAVGSAAARIARRQGARVLGVVRKKADLAAASASKLPVDVWLDLESAELSKSVREATAGKGADVILDVVGGPMFEKCLAALAWRGRQVAISSSPEPRVSLNLVDFYHNESRLFGADSLKISFQEAGEILRALTPGFESGEFPPPEIKTFPYSRKGLEAYPRDARVTGESQSGAGAVVASAGHFRQWNQTIQPPPPQKPKKNRHHPGGFSGQRVPLLGSVLSKCRTPSRKRRRNQAGTETHQTQGWHVQSTPGNAGMIRGPTDQNGNSAHRSDGLAALRLTHKCRFSAGVWAS